MDIIDLNRLPSENLSRRNKPSYVVRMKKQDPMISFEHGYMKSPAGIKGIAIFAKLFDMERIHPYQIIQLLQSNERNKVEHMIESSKKLTRDEKYFLYEFLNKFDKHHLRVLMENAHGNRIDHLLERREIYPDIEMGESFPSISTLGFRKKKSKHTKVKRKPVKKCKCKK